MAKQKRNNKKRGNKKKRDFQTRVVDVRRVAKMRKGDRLLSFTALVVVGNEKGEVGVALGKGQGPREAIMKGERLAKKHRIKVSLSNGTIPHDIKNKYKAAKVFLKPAPKGTGVIAGGAVRTVLELAGIENVVSKQYGSSNPIPNAYCTLKALEKMRAVE